MAFTTTTLYVAAMDCGEEASLIDSTLRPIPGVQGVHSDIPRKLVAVSHDQSVAADALIAALSAVGLTATLTAADTHNKVLAQRQRQTQLVGISGAALTAALLNDYFAGGGVTARLLLLVSIASAGILVLPKGFRAAANRRLDMNVLMCVAVAGALLIGEWEEAASVIFLFSLAELLETLSIARARKAIGGLLDIVPKTALIRRGESTTEVLAAELQIDDVALVKSGARIPADGIVKAGFSSVNQAPITGESMPVEKTPGSPVFAGTINGEGSLEVAVTKLAADTTLAKIIHLVEEAQSVKAPSERFVDTFARYYTPAVFAASLLLLLLGPLMLGGGLSTWFYRALVLLVIACPCALVIATPVSIVSALTALAHRGVLIKGGAHLEEIGKLRVLALDKTGTLTEGTPKVLEVVRTGDLTEEQIVQVAAAIDTHSHHPLAQAVVRYANEKQIPFVSAVNYQSNSGRGAKAEIDGHLYFVGNHRFAHELGVCSPNLEAKLANIEKQARSVVIVGHMPHGECTGSVVGILSVADSIRPNAKQAISALRKTGLKQIVLLSGDNQMTAEAVGREVGVDLAVGDLLPEQKVERIRQLVAQERFVGMIGDGVNDAPALAAANVGIAMAAIGSDAAIETADIALMHDDLSRVAEVIIAGRRTVSIIRANILFALTVKALFLALAVFGATSLWLAILADTGATLCVIANALRLLKQKS